MVAAAKAYLSETRGLNIPELESSLAALEEATDWIVQTGAKDPRTVTAVCVPYLQAFGIIAGGVVMGKATKAAENDTFGQSKAATSTFYMSHILPLAGAYLQTVMNGSAAVENVSDDIFAQG